MAQKDCVGVVVDEKGRTVLRLMRRGYLIDPERSKKIKRMLASSTMMERVLPSLHANFAKDAATQAKLVRKPELLGQIFEDMLNRLVPIFDTLDDQTIDEVTKFQESTAAKVYGKCLELMIAKLPEIAVTWETEARKKIEAS